MRSAPPRPDGTRTRETPAKPARTAPCGHPRLGFLGLGWIGRMRLESAVRTGAAEVVALADPSDDGLEACAALAPDARRCQRLDDLLQLDLDGVVIATPSALHAAQAERTLRRGMAVFCQKPLGRNERECLRVIEAARGADRLLGVDFCYRYTRAARALKAIVRSGEIGRVYAMDLVFHNAHGPDKPWFYARSQAGGGCLLDLGIHLVDLALWLADDRRVADARGALLAGGRPLPPRGEVVEDYATAELSLESGARARIACSWGLHAGVDAVISVEVHGTEGGCALRNVGGSFYDFVAERRRGTSRWTVVEPPDPWGGRAVEAWVRRLGSVASYDPRVETVVEVARTLDRVYAS